MGSDIRLRSLCVAIGWGVVVGFGVSLLAYALGMSVRFVGPVTGAIVAPLVTILCLARPEGRDQDGAAP